jgi:hypothetical protein
MYFKVLNFFELLDAFLSITAARPASALESSTSRSLGGWLDAFGVLGRALPAPLAESFVAVRSEGGRWVRSFSTAWSVLMGSLWRAVRELRGAT